MLFKAIVTAIALSTLILAPTAWSADFESASEAYRNQNYTAAFEEFSTLAEAGDPRAQTVIAIMYKYGESVTLDLAKAYDWYLRAAIQGYPPAQYNVGLMLADGIGVERDPDNALTWLQKAVDAGYERANDKIAEITGDKTIAMPDDEPIAWSKSWNLRLPNEIRDEAPPAKAALLEVYRVQLGAMSTLERAQRMYQALAEAHPAHIGEHQPIYRKTNRGGQSIYRLQLGSFSDSRSANLYCETLKQVTPACIVVLTD